MVRRVLSRPTVWMFSAALFLFTAGARHRMLTGGGHEAVEVSHRRVVDEGVGDHGCGLVWYGDE